MYSLQNHSSHRPNHELEWLRRALKDHIRNLHPALSVLDNDVLGYIGRFLEGVNVNEDTLAIDLINATGPIPGFFLNTDHTRGWWQKEQFMPHAADMLTYPEWLKTGKKTALDYVRGRADELLASWSQSCPPARRKRSTKSWKSAENGIRRRA